MRELFIADRRIADDTPAFVVAEIGHNHQGDMDKCRELFRAAADCGADAVKLQKRDNRSLFTPEVYNGVYNSEHAYGPTYGLHREALEFEWHQYVELKGYAERLGLIFFATAFDIPSAAMLWKLGCPAIKVASGCLTDVPLLCYISETGLPAIVSTGGGILGDVTRMYEVFRPDYPLAILQCTAAYPVEAHEMNLKVIETYRREFPHNVIGLSDHQSGIAMAPVAYALGARIIEKHFTLNRAWKGSDQAFSLEPVGLRKLVRDLKRVHTALGDGIKRPYESEGPGLRKMAKSIVAVRDLKAGHILRPKDLECRSPSGGLPPYNLQEVLGRTLREPLAAMEALRWTHII